MLIPVHPTPDVDRLLSRLRDIPGVVVVGESHDLDTTAAHNHGHAVMVIREAADRARTCAMTDAEALRLFAAERHERLVENLLAQVASNVPTFFDDARPMNRAQRRAQTRRAGRGRR